MQNEDSKLVAGVIRTGPFKSVIPDAVLAGNLIFLSGQVSVDAQGKLVGRCSLNSQLRQIYQNVQGILAQYGAGLGDIVDETVFTLDVESYLSERERSFETRREVFGFEPQLTQTLVQVSRLANPEWLLEIKCVARLSPPTRHV